ncbi:MAG: HPr family phosphocarrier protein [Chitinivibrionales bacterium]|nr:HPr family phosphocarrier protein [Chitinivibrionales bacterium]MBD3358562.1 HPr family phosphocarrier protein [Chitinivibrionales bacterium]
MCIIIAEYIEEARLEGHILAENTVTVVNPKGIHARPSSLIAKTASKFLSSVTLQKETDQADAKSVMEILMLCIPCGTELIVRATGPDEDAAVRAVTDVINVLFERD